MNFEFFRFIYQGYQHHLFKRYFYWTQAMTQKVNGFSELTVEPI